MSLSKLPFDILGQVGPILCWVESDDGGPLPDTWSSLAQPFRDRENGWLLQELPTYSYDNVEEIVIGTRFRQRRTKMRPAKLPFVEDQRRQRLDPPWDYDVVHALRRLSDRFMVWNGTEPCIRAGLMEELHELALRMPAGHIVRHGHARMVAEGVISLDDALDLPENVTLLPSNSFGLRKVVRKGLSESHLHLSAVTSAEETWADSLLRPLASGSVTGGTPQERRLLVLNLFAGRILALATWMSMLEKDACTTVGPTRLLALLDRLYFAREPYAERFAARELEEAIRSAVYGRTVARSDKLDELERTLTEVLEKLQTARAEDASARLRKPSAKVTKLEGRLVDLRARLNDRKKHDRRCASVIAQPVPEDFRFLLRWISPSAWRLNQMGSQSRGLPGNVPETLDHRYRLVHRLHLAAHLRLVQMSTRLRAGESDPRGPGEKNEDPRRHFLHRALFRYLVCRTHHWQMATQQGRTTGLRQFKRYFDSPHRRPKNITSLQKAELVFDRLRLWRGLRVLEGRVAPPNQSEDLVPWILAYARPEDRRIKKFGLVVHFKKEPEHTEERSMQAKTPSPVPRLRWGRRRRRIRDEGLRLYRMLRRPTPVTPFVVGIDACNLELATPPEVFAPVFRFLREYPISLMGDPRQFSPYLGLDANIRALAGNRRLGMTYHVGEDFRHLLSGLRAISEVVEFLSPQPGDRLGHGTALALAPARWMEHNGYQAVMPKLEWLDTLVWVHHFLGPGDDLVGELAIEDLIQGLSADIYSSALATRFDPLSLGQTKTAWRGPERRAQAEPPRRGLMDWDWSPLTLWDAWRLRQLDPYGLDLASLFRGELRMKTTTIHTEEERRWQSVQERILRKERRSVGSRNAYVLLGLYWLDPGVRQRGDEITVVKMYEDREAWLKLCCRVEERMKLLIHQKELVVEVNPSSNRIIGPMASYDQHHVFELTLDDKHRLARGVRVSVNTDNPAVCNTTLAHEHYLLGEVLIARGVPEAEAVEWLEWLRQNGEDYNFVRRLKSPEESADMKRLLDWLRGIRKSVREARSRDEKNHAFWTWLQETRLRALGFSSARIAKEADVLDRIVRSERRLADLQGRLGEERDVSPSMAEELESMAKDIEELRRRVGPATSRDR
ncbi:MAG: hypothetical protein AAGM22_17895 [Acidobacteriota bacterium]